MPKEPVSLTITSERFREKMEVCFILSKRPTLAAQLSFLVVGKRYVRPFSNEGKICITCPYPRSYFFQKKEVEILAREIISDEFFLEEIVCDTFLVPCQKRPVTAILSIDFLQSDMPEFIFPFTLTKKPAKNDCFLDVFFVNSMHTIQISDDGLGILKIPNPYFQKEGTRPKEVRVLVRAIRGGGFVFPVTSSKKIPLI